MLKFKNTHNIAIFINFHSGNKNKELILAFMFYIFNYIFSILVI